MRSLRLTSRATACTLAAAMARGATASARGADKVPITTSSDEARGLYLKGRDLAEKLRATDARTCYERAVAKDPDFALAHIGLANTAPTTKAFIDSVGRAVALAPRVSEGERHIMMAADAGLKGNALAVVSHDTDLVRLFPNDERAHALLRNIYFGRQEYDAMGGDLVLMGDVLREAGRLDDAAKKYDEAVAVVSAAQVPDEMKAANRRNNVRACTPRHREKRPGVRKARTAQYAQLVESRKVPFELRQLHELNGSIALAGKRATAAVQELKQANQQDPRILYLMVVALRRVVMRRMPRRSRQRRGSSTSVVQRRLRPGQGVEDRQSVH